MEPFKFYWNTFSLKNGLYFLAVIALLYLLSFWIEFPWYFVGLSVVLAWIVIIFGQPKTEKKILMVFLYLVIGTGLTMLHNILVDTYWPWLISMFLVAFLGTYLIKFGTPWFILGWCLILWYIMFPVTSQAVSPQDLLISHILGSSGVLLLVIISVFWEKNKKKDKTDEKEEITQAADTLPEWWALTYSFIVASVVVLGLIIGHKYLSDATTIANSTYMIIGFTGSIAIWKIGLERIIGITSGVLIGYYLGVYFQSPDLGMAIMIVGYFLLLATVTVNNGMVMFFLVLILSYGWGLADIDSGNITSNEKLIGELAGVILAGVAILILNFSGRFFKPKL